MIRKLLITALLLCASLAVAQPGPGGHKEMPGKMMMKEGHNMLLPPGRWWKNADVVKEIGLDDTQVQKIEQIFQESRLKLVDIHADLEKAELKLEPQLEAQNPDESAVLDSIDRIAAARATLEKVNARMAFAIRRVLTPEQWKKLREMRPRHEHFPQPMDGPHGEHHGHHDGPMSLGIPPAPPPIPPDAALDLPPLPPAGDPAPAGEAR